MFTRSDVHVGIFLVLKMSSKKNKNKSKRGDEGDGSIMKEDSSLQTSGHEGGSCKSLNSFTVIDFIDKGRIFFFFYRGP